MYVYNYICVCMKQARPASSFARRRRRSRISTSVARSASRTRLATRWTNCKRSPKVRRHPMGSPWVPGSWRVLLAVLQAPQAWLAAPVDYPGPQSPTRQPSDLRAPRPAPAPLPPLLSDALRPRPPSAARLPRPATRVPVQGGLHATRARSAPMWHS